MKKQINIFYSWQSDLDRYTNQDAIRIEIKKVIPVLENELDEFDIRVDEATSRVAGSPEIPTTILEKIDICDVFICDMTTVNNDSSDSRKMPNPNVIFELGYAVSFLGWNRIIMLFNENYGNFNTELPFDLEKRRIVSFNISDKDDTNGKGQLRTNLKNNIELIIKNNPEKESKKNLNTNKVDPRTKDIENLCNLLSTIHIGVFELYLYHLPNRILDKIFFFLYGFQEIFHSVSFHLYDKVLLDKISNFINLWEKTLQHSNLFKPDGSGNYNLYIPFDVFERREDEIEFSLLVDETNLLRVSFEDLIKYIRNEYMEIDVDQLCKIAGENYNKYHEDKK